MKTIFTAAFCAASLVCGLVAAAEPQAPTDAEIRARQALGRALVSPDGKFFVYEWMRPYNWVRDTGTIPESATSRMQAWLYRVDVEPSPANSEYLFFPGPGASYWLGAFSPDGGKLSFYELDNDRNVLRAGVAAFTDPLAPKLTWFEPAPDGAKLDQPPVWLSNDELVYPAPGGVRLVANAANGETAACQDCEQRIAQLKAADSDGKAKPKAKQASKPAPGMRVLARSSDGELTVYEKSVAKVLGLTFTQGADAPETVVFENERKLAAWSAPKWPERKDDADKPPQAKPGARTQND